MPEPRWLDDDEQRAWRAFITAAVQLQRTLEHDLKAHHDLTMDDYALLAMLGETPDGRARFGELAEVLRVPKTHITYRFQRLEDRGLVVREACLNDKRGAFARMTERGRQLIDDAAPTHVAGVRTHFLDHLSRSQLAAVGEAMAAVVAAEADVGACPNLTRAS